MSTKAIVLFGDKRESVLQAMLEEANKYPATYEEGLGFWKGKAEKSYCFTYNKWADALNAATRIREVGEQEAVLIVLQSEEDDYHYTYYGVLAVKDGFEDLGDGCIFEGLSKDGSGFCNPQTLECWHFS